MELISANLESKTIDELCFGQDKKKYLFHIPTYQRGFRWNEHVIKLIEDLQEYKQAKDKKKNVGDYYCLQPIIVKRLDKHDSENDICYEVVDGQQRLTTVFILLKVFGYNKKSFSISFERDSSSKEREKYLANIKDVEEEQASKADFYYMKNAFTISTKWLQEKSAELGTMSLDDDMRAILMKNTRVIWYELDANSSGREVFRNINYGKLRLTNSELIKAMLLNSKHYSPPSGDAGTQDKVVRIEQERMARLWDEIESTLQDENFWAFISNGEIYSTRINYIFDLIYHKDKNSKYKRSSYSIFDYFEKRLSEESDDALERINLLWDDVRTYYRTFQDWYVDVKLYNYIGYLVHYLGRGIQGIISIKQHSQEKTKDEFLSWLRDEITYDVKVQNIEELTYEEDRKTIEKLLLVFNIEIANEMKRRFNFVIDGGWSVEHVFARQSVNIQEKDRKNWIEKYIPIVRSAIMSATDEDNRDTLIELKKSLDDYVSNEKGDFVSLFNNIIEMVECKGAEVDSICNLALIGMEDNASLSNSAFYQKRKKIIDMVEHGRNIPQATINLYMKFYSGLVTNLDYWSVDDGKAYLERLEQSLSYLIKCEEA